ncbi:MAG: hypothetical protein WA004_05680 [Saprospiraceae bacterium]
MKRRLLLLSLLALLSFTGRLSAQAYVDMALYNNPPCSDKLEVRLRPTQDVNNLNFSAGIFTVRFPSSLGGSLSVMSSPYGYSFAGPAGTDGTYDYYRFQFVVNNFVTWTANQEYVAAILQYSGGPAVGGFELITGVTWTMDNNGDFYVELAGDERQGIFYLTPSGEPDVPTVQAVPSTICSGSNSTLSVTSGNLNNAAYWQWYSGSCGGTPVGTGASLVVSPITTTTYYVRGEGGCAMAGACASVTVTVDPGPTASAGGSATICENSSYTLTAGEATASNGTILWTHNGAGSLSNETTLTPTYTAAAGDAGTAVTLTLTVTNNACTPSTATATYTINVEALHTLSLTSAAGTDNQTVCITSAITDITYAVGGGATGASVSGLPNGVSFNYNAGVLTISGSSNVSGTFNYTVTTSGGVCPPATANGTIIVKQEPNATTGGDATVCITQVSYVLTGNTPSQGTGTWSIYGASASLNLSQFSDVNDPQAVFTPDLVGVYFLRWTISNPPCPDDFANMTLTFTQISADPVSATASPSTICNGQSTTLTLNGGGGGDYETIQWYTGSCGGTSVGSGNNLVVSPTSTTTYYGRYENGAPCNYASACAEVTVTVAAAVAISCPADATESACQDQTAINTAFTAWINSFGFTGGLNASGSFDGGAPTAPPACGGSVTVTYRVESDCEPDVTCTRTFTVTAAPVVISCPSDATEAACQDQTAINAAFTAWINSFSFTGGCNASGSFDGGTPTAPLACGGSVTVTYRVESDCEADVTCTKTFTVTAAPAVVINCPSDATEAACQDQTAINAAFTAWINSFSFTGGCNASGSFDGGTPTAPLACGGSVTVTYRVESDCEADVTCTKTFTVTAAPAVAINCPSDATEAACQDQTAINTAFTAWINSFGFTGGCNASGSFDGGTPTAPPACGGSVTVTYRVESDCEADVTCTRTFTVTAAPAEAISCPSDATESACQDQTAINTAFTAWINSFGFTGGCNASGSFDGGTPTAPPACGGSVTVTYRVTSSCEADVTCTRTFTVTAAPAVAISCPSDATEAACQDQTAINTAFTAWINSFSFTGGCNASGSFDGGTPTAPPACGGSVTVTYRVESDCEADVTCTRTFTVTAAPAVSFVCASDQTEAACQTQSAIDNAFALWLSSTTASGGCNGVLTTVPATPAAPPACGGSTSVTWNYTGDCGLMETCTKNFTVTAAPAVAINCPSDATEAACQDQTAINTAFTAWINSFGFTGGCNASGSFDGGTPTAPLACGGSVTVTYRVTSSCEADVTCTRTFTVTAAPAVAISCPSDATEAACQDQTAINTAFTAWINSFSFTGGCNASGSFDGGTPSAPLACGGSVTVTYRVTSSCEADVTCTRTFTVTAAPVVISCPSDATEAACQDQTAINTAFTAWINSFGFTGGCNASGSFDGGTPTAPPACGGSVTVTYRVESDCEADVTCTRTFTVTAAPVSLNCPSDQNIACQDQTAINTAFANWLNSFGFTGGCNAMGSFDGGVPAAPICGGSVMVTYRVESDCEADATCTRTFSVTAVPTNITIVDPCTCLNNATTLANGQFSEIVEVTAPTGQTWTVVTAPGLYQTASPAPPAAPLPVAAGTPLVETPAGSGIYLLTGKHVDALGYSISVTNGSVTLSTSNTCYYPNPAFSGLNAVYCSQDGPQVVTLTAQLGDGSGPAPVEDILFELIRQSDNAVVATQSGVATTFNFDPSTLAQGLYTLRATFDAAGTPGCAQAIEAEFEVRKVGCGNFPWNGN